jgi:hypothetical protein
MNHSLIRGSERLYGFVLRFYPASFRREFGREMAYVFTESLQDACSEQGGRGVTRLWGRTIADATKSVVIQHIENQKERYMKTNSKNGILQNSFVRVALATAILMLLPLAASLLLEDFNWGVFDFVFTAGLLFVAGLSFDLLTRRSGNMVYRAAFAVAIGTAAFLFFSNLAVGILGSDDEPANVLYVGVIAIAVIGAVLARFRARGMAWAMFATALAQASTIVIALLLGIHQHPESSVLFIFGVNGFFMTGWIVAGLLFRWASETEYEVESKPAAS